MVFDIAPKVNYHHTKQQDSVQIKDLAECMDLEIVDSNFHHTKQQDSVQNQESTENSDTPSMEIDNVRMIDRRRQKLSLVSAESSDMEIDDEEDIDFEATLSVYQKLQFSINEPDEKIATDDAIIKKIINSPDVSSALDRTNTANESFVIILAAIARALEVDLNDCVFSSSTLLRRRYNHRDTIAETVKTEFLASIKFGLVVHWDGKRLKDTTADKSDERNTKVERIAIVVTGLNIQKILAIAKSDDGTGVVVSDIVYEHLEAWTIVESIVAMCTDTTAANPGCNNGACVLLEQMMQKNLVYFACRHHIFELVIGGIFILLFGETTGPFTEMFENFKRDWCQINKASFKPLNKNIFKKKFLKELRDDVINYIGNILVTKVQRFVPRGDYLEMMQLCLLVLGETIRNYTFKLPHNCSNARWMGKVIYSLKIFLFREQVNLSDVERANLEEFCIFACLIYTKIWIQCCVPSNAPLNDLDFLKTLNRYSRINKKIADCAINKFQEHLWYLGSELVVLSLFSDKVDVTIKYRMFEKMKQLDDGEWTQRNYKLTFEKCTYKKELFDLVGSTSMSVLKSLKIDMDFMFENDVNRWKHLCDYKKAKDTVDSFKVVNDTAERALKMMTDYNDSLTTNEEKK